MSLKNFWAYARVIYHAAEMSFRSNMTDSFILFGIIIQPIIIALLAFWMLGSKGGEYIIFVVVGSGMTGLWTSCLFVSGNSITEERWSGTLELIVNTPTPVPVIVIGKILSNVVQSLLSMILSYSLAILIFGYIPTIAQPGLFGLSLIFAIIAYACFGLIISPVFVLNPDVQRLQNGLEFPVYVLCGFLFPIALLPGWTTPLSYILSPYWAARALHATSSAWTGLEEVFLCWGMMLALGLFYVTVSAFLFRRLVHRARVDATLRTQ